MRVDAALAPRQPVTVMLFALVVAGFGSAFSLNAIAVSEIPALWVAATRACVACAIFAAVVAVSGRSIPFARRDLATYALVGATTGAIPFFLLAWGQSIVPSSLAGVLFASVPLMTVFLSRGFFAGPHPTRRRATGSMLGLVGVAIAFPNAASVTSGQMAGAGAIVATAVSYAFGGLFLQRARSYDPFALMFGQFLLVAVTLLFAGFLLAEPLPSVEDAVPYAAALLLGATGSAMPLMCFFLLLRRTEPVIASSVTFFIPFLAVSIGVVLLDEPSTASLLIGFAVCTAGSLLVLRSPPSN